MDHPNELSDDEIWSRIQSLWRSGELAVSYPDLLKEPIFIDKKRWGDNSSVGNVEKLLTAPHKKYRSNMQRTTEIKTKRLFDWYGIDTADEPAAWKAMAQALIAQHVPGFKIIHELPEPPRRPGAPRKPPEQLIAYFTAVSMKKFELQEKRKAAKVKTTQAIDAVFKNWQPAFGKKPNSLKAATTRFYEIKKLADKMTREPQSPLMKLMNPD